MDFLLTHRILLCAFDTTGDENYTRLLTDLTQQAVTEPEKRLLCKRCGQAITRQQDRIEITGSHSHTFTNPHGISFHIGCFREAPGCFELGEATDEFTWFPGYAWRIAYCKSCRYHLGWSYSSNKAERFYGLILDHLAHPQ